MLDYSTSVELRSYLEKRLAQISKQIAKLRAERLKSEKKDKKRRKKSKKT